MKKLAILIFTLIISIPLFAQLDSKQLVGKWKYAAKTDQGEITGTFRFEELSGKLMGTVITNEGYEVPFSKIELREKNVLYFEVTTDTDVIKVTLTIEGEKFKGTGTSFQGEVPVTGEKLAQ